MTKYAVGDYCWLRNGLLGQIVVAYYETYLIRKIKLGFRLGLIVREKEIARKANVKMKETK